MRVIYLDNRDREHTFEEARGGQFFPRRAGRTPALNMSEHDVLREWIKFNERLTVEERTRRLINPSQAQPPRLTLRRQFLVAVTVAAVFIKLFVYPRHDRYLRRFITVRLRHDLLGDGRERARLCVSEETNLRHFFQTFAHDLTRLVVPVGR